MVLCALGNSNLQEGFLSFLLFHPTIIAGKVMVLGIWRHLYTERPYISANIQAILFLQAFLLMIYADCRAMESYWLILYYIIGCCLLAVGNPNELYGF